MSDATRGESAKEAASRRTFDRWAGTFDRSRTLGWLRERALGELELRPDDRLLDVGCGAGRLVLRAAPLVERAAGVDLAPRMIERARAAAGAAERVRFEVGSAQRLPFRDGEFTVVTTTTALHHFPDPAAAAAELARLTAPGGRVLVGDICADSPVVAAVDPLLRRFEPGHVRFQRSAGLRDLLAGAGLEVVRRRRLLAGAYAFVLARRPG